MIWDVLAVVACLSLMGSIAYWAYLEITDRVNDEGR